MHAKNSLRVAEDGESLVHIEEFGELRDVARDEGLQRKDIVAFRAHHLLDRRVQLGRFVA